MKVAIVDGQNRPLIVWESADVAVRAIASASARNALRPGGPARRRRLLGWRRRTVRVGDTEIPGEVIEDGIREALRDLCRETVRL